MLLRLCDSVRCGYVIEIVMVDRKAGRGEDVNIEEVERLGNEENG